MGLAKIYQPIRKELSCVEALIKSSLRQIKNKRILEITGYLLDSGGKRIRPALVLLSAKVFQPSSKRLDRSVICVASAIELIHVASLIHDDVLDHAQTRHNRPTINLKYGQDVSITAGDYLYSRASELVSGCANLDVLSCISQASRLMCEGQLVQVCERGNLDLSKSNYLVFIKKKTAALFSASCHSGAILSGASSPHGDMLKEFGLNFGIAFQMADDCHDLVKEEKDLGKRPGADLRMGELTLPLLNLISQGKNKKKMLSWIGRQHSRRSLSELRERFRNSYAAVKTKDEILLYTQRAKQKLDGLAESAFKESLLGLADFISDRARI